MTDYSKHFSTRETPQSEPIPGRETEMTEGRAGGYVFPVDDWTRLERFLILGSEANTYYASARELTRENAEAALRLIKSDGIEVVEWVENVSIEGRAASNDPALFILALASAEGDEETRKAAYEALPEVARIGTHLFHFMQYRKAFAGWGRGVRRALSNWYLEKPLEKLAYQVIKYQQRDGWSHRDVLRIAHPQTDDGIRNGLFHWITQGPSPGTMVPPLIGAYEQLKNAESVEEVVQLVRKHGLPRETIPTEFLNEPKVWRALLYAGEYGMPLGALVRNLGNLSKHGLLDSFSEAQTFVVHKLMNDQAIKASRLHPYSILLAAKNYGEGQGWRGSGEWDVNQKVLTALDTAFHLAFQNVEPVDKNILLALDVSGSMGSSRIQNSNLTAREGSAAMAMVTARTEPDVEFLAFSHELVPISITQLDTINTVIEKTRKIPFGRTDCALPMLWALGMKPETMESGYGYGRPRHTGSYSKFRDSVIPVDAFVIYTDSETWSGGIHPAQALKKYREVSGIGAKLVVVGMTSNGFSIADPDDAGMLDVVGFDSAAPQLINEFLK